MKATLRGPVSLLLRRGAQAFSLIEVVMALAVASFCLIAVIGLLPMGLTTAKNSREQTGAAALVEQMSLNIRNAATNSSSANAYVPMGTGSLTALTWKLGDAQKTMSFTNSLGGATQSTTENARLKSIVVLTAPANAYTPGTALVSAAWPVQAQWNTATKSWTNAAGSVDSWIVFLPRK